MKGLLLLISLIFLASHPTLANQDKVLVILSEQDQLPLKNGRTYSTGFFLNELMLPVLALKKSKYALVFATPNGELPSLDASSDSPKYFTNNNEYLEAKQLLAKLGLLEKNRSPVISFQDTLNRLEEFKGVFVPGGHAPMIDLAFSKKLGKILTYFHNENKPTALICHGPISLLSTLANPYRATEETTNEPWIYKNYKMTVYTNDEEEYTEKKKMSGKLLFYPENALRNAGANLQQSRMWSANVVRDRELITGQNPISDQKFIKIFLKGLTE